MDLASSRCRNTNQYAEDPGDSSGEATPVPIPNTEVKLSSAEDTERAAFRENRSSPGFLRFRGSPSAVPDRGSRGSLRYPSETMTVDPHAPDAPDAAADRVTAPDDDAATAPGGAAVTATAAAIDPVKTICPYLLSADGALAERDRRSRAPLHRGHAGGAARGREAAPALPDRLARRVRHLHRRDRGASRGASRDDDPPPDHPHHPGRARPRPAGRRHPRHGPLAIGRAGGAGRPARDRVRGRPGRAARVGRRIGARGRRRPRGIAIGLARVRVPPPRRVMRRPRSRPRGRPRPRRRPSHQARPWSPPRSARARRARTRPRATP